jgi:hypothetical protein
MAERHELVAALALAFEQAVRASVAKGAQYVEGEQINLDTKTLWEGVAEGLVKVVEKVIEERQPKPENEQPDPQPPARERSRGKRS